MLNGGGRRGDHHDDARHAYYDAVADVVHVAASGFLATHNASATSRGHASDRHPSSYRGYRDRQSEV